jgi:hypothetical protein
LRTGAGALASPVTQSFNRQAIKVLLVGGEDDVFNAASDHLSPQIVARLWR